MSIYQLDVYLSEKKEKDAYLNLNYIWPYLSIRYFQMQNLKLVMFNFMFKSQKIEKEKENANKHYQDGLNNLL